MAGFDINWGLAQPVDVGGRFLQGFEQGQQQRQKMDARNALMGYAKNPSQETLAPIVEYNPELYMQERARLQNAEQLARRQQVTQRAVTGDPAARDELAGLDADMWMKLDDRQREQIKKATSFMGEAALAIGRLPDEASRAAAWTQYVRQAEAGGMDIPEQYERYSPQALQAAVAETEKVSEYIKQFEPDYRVVPQGGYLENVNPLSRSTGVPSGPPPGTPPPPPGFILDQGGPTQPASGGFPGQ